MKAAGGSARLNEITLSVCVLCVCCVCMCVHNWLMRQHSQGAIQQTNSLSQTVLNNMKRPLQELPHSSLEAASKQSVNGALGEATQRLHRLKGETVKWSLVVHTWNSQPLNCRIMFWCFSRASCRIFSAGSIFQRHSVPTGLVWCLEGGHTNTHRRQLRNNFWRVSMEPVTAGGLLRTKTLLACRCKSQWVQVQRKLGGSSSCF